MCGIFGYYGRCESQDFLKSKLSMMNFRGPDSSGFWTNEVSVGLGANRLAMVDPNKASNQPMVRDGYCLVFNGEIYNHLELREKFCVGLTFDTRSDTETLLRLLQIYGKRILDELNGMYALAFFNSGTNEILLARDKLGKKPLYFIQEENQLLFSSTIAPLVNEGSFELKLEAIFNYLRLGFDPIYGSPYSGIEKVAPGSAQLFKQDAIGRISRCEAKAAAMVGPTPKSVHDVSKLSRAKIRSNLRDTLKNAVEIRIQDQSNIGLSLSGGVDSSILAILLKELGADFKSYSVHWSDADKSRYNEDFFSAREISRILHIPFNEVNCPTPDSLMHEIDNFIRAVEEPNNNATGISMMWLYKAMSKDEVRCVLTGDGADEILYGYSRYNVINKAFEIKKKMFLNGLGLPKWLNVFPKFSQSAVIDFDSWAHWHDTFKISAIRQSSYLNRQSQMFAKHDSELRFELLNRFLPIDATPFSRMAYFDLNFWLVNESNLRLDKVSMFHSIEARAPYQDERLISQFWFDVREDFSMINNKQILKESFPELNQLPILKDKKGFISPIGHWMRRNEFEVKEQIDFLRHRGLLPRIDTTHSILTGGDFKKIRGLWTLIVLARWLKVMNM